jgi:HlyD family secretion protein
MNKTNGHVNPNGNGKGTASNPNGHKVATSPLEPESVTLAKQELSTPSSQFEHPLILQQSSHWSHWILWTLMGVTTAGVIWSCIATIEESIPALGKLEPQGNVKEVQVPINGVVKQVQVKDGQAVKKGDVLLRLDPTTSQAQVAALRAVQKSLRQENQFYRDQLAGASFSLPTVTISEQYVNLVKYRRTLIAENRLFRSQLDGTDDGLTVAQRERLQTNQEELNKRETSAQLDAAQLTQQLSQAGIKLEATKKILATNQRILDDMAPLLETGAIARVQYLRQEQEVETKKAEVEQLIKEQARLQLAISQAFTKADATVAVDRKDLTARLSDNEQRIAQVDSQLTKAIVENEKRIAEIEGQTTQAKQTLKYTEVRSPVDGIVFDLKASTPGFVPTSTEPVLKIVPQEALLAKVSITNQDIGFVKEGMSVDVRIDSFPFSEFGDIKGKLVWIGSDALPPTEIQPYYTFPAKVKLEQQSLKANERIIPLQSGMSLSANIKVRKRTIMSIFTDQFVKTTESFKFIR